LDEDGRANSIHEKYAKAFEMPTRGDRKKRMTDRAKLKKDATFQHTQTHTHPLRHPDPTSDFRFDDK